MDESVGRVFRAVTHHIPFFVGSFYISVHRCTALLGVITGILPYWGKGRHGVASQGVGAEDTELYCISFGTRSLDRIQMMRWRDAGLAGGGEISPLA